MKSARPRLSANELQDLLDKFRGGPRRPWEVVGAAEKHLRLAHYFHSLSEKSMSALQDIYKWDILLHSYKLHPFT